MKIENITPEQKKKLIYTTSGAGAGIIAGGTFGYFQKPWIKDNDISDTFVKKASQYEDKLNQKDFETFITDLKAIYKSGNTANVHEITKEYFDGIETPQEAKAQSENLLNVFKEHYDADNYDDILDKYKSSAKIKDDDMPWQKERIKSFIDIQNKKLKTPENDFDLSDKNLYEAVKKTVREINLKNVCKWAAIAGGVLGAAGFGITFLGRKQK